MITIIQRANVLAVEDNLALKFVPVMLDLIVLDHYDDEVDVCEECIKVVVLVRDHILLDEGVIDLQWFCEVTFLTLK